MPKPITKNQMSDFWYAEYGDRGHCCLCGNNGYIDTREKVQTPAGHECGDLVWCICPNGRVMKRQTGMRKPPNTIAVGQRVPFTPEAHMSSAGAELMALSREMMKKGFDPMEAHRIREIGAWVSVGRPSDLENASVQVVGGIVRVMRQAGYDFEEDKPIVAQWEDFVKGLLGEETSS